MIYTFLKKLSFIFLIAGVFSIFHAFAAEQASISLNPKNPTPHTAVTLTLVSYSFDVNTALITWSSQGKEILKGVGEKRLIVETGGAGEQFPILVKAITAEGTETELEMTIVPESVDILYETPESYVPMFYEGHTLPGEGADVRFVAMPNISEDGVLLPPSSLSYAWYVNGSFMDKVSGIGRRTALLRLDYLNTYTTIKVIAHGPRGETATKSIEVYPHAVMPMLYTYDEILGVNRTTTLIRRFETSKDFTLALEPYYLSTKGGNLANNNFAWYLDNLPIDPENVTLLPFRTKADSYGSRNLMINITNPIRKLQTASIKLNLIFDTRK